MSVQFMTGRFSIAISLPVLPRKRYILKRAVFRTCYWPGNLLIKVNCESWLRRLDTDCFLHGQSTGNEERVRMIPCIIREECITWTWFEGIEFGLMTGSTRSSRVHSDAWHARKGRTTQYVPWTRGPVQATLNQACAGTENSKARRTEEAKLLENIVKR